MKKILIIDDEYPVRDVIKIALTENGYTVIEAADGKEGIQAFKDSLPDIVLTDVKMPGLSGIEVTKKIKEIKSDVDVIIMTGYGTEELVIEALRSGASNYIKKPASFKELFNILNNLILKRETRKRFEVNKDIVVFEKKTMLVNNDISKVWGIVNQILFNIPSYIDKSTVEGMRLGLYEILVNAIEHGNLGITSEEKEEALNNNTYTELLKRHLSEAKKKDKKINIQSVIENEKLIIEVHDHGSGFDFKGQSALADPETILALHGRGILLASLYFDKLEYKGSGNHVIVEKTIKP